jgi:hypothetical protein
MGFESAPFKLTKVKFINIKMKKKLINQKEKNKAFSNIKIFINLK